MTTEAEDSRKGLCFVVGPIGQIGSDTRRHADWLLKGIVKPALETIGYQVKRADEDARPGMINDGIIHDLLTAEIVVADLTELNPNAFYELGIRHSSMKPTIHIAKTGTIIPFDNTGHACIFIDITEVDDVARKIDIVRSSAKEITKDGFRVSNPITQANGSFRIKESADSKDQMFVRLAERVDLLEDRYFLQSEEIKEQQIRNQIDNVLANEHAGWKNAKELSIMSFINWKESNKRISAKTAVETALYQVRMRYSQNDPIVHNPSSPP